MFIDSHAHLEYPDFEEDLDMVIRRAKSSGVVKIINVGTTIENIKKGLLLEKRFKGIVYPTAGLHPHDIDDEISFKKQLEELESLVKTEKFYAIGECGLDYSRILEGSKKERFKYEARRQKELFLAQLLIAQKNKLPVVIHSRMAEKDTCKILSSNSFSKLRGVIHCYTGTKEFVEKVLEFGFYVGFTGIITFPKAVGLREVVKMVPIERILVETDCPFIAPVPYRGQRNEPAYVVEVAKKIAEIKGMNLEEVASVTTKNTEELFGV